MIDFRYLLVTIAAVFLAIATGLVLGAGPLGESEDSTTSDTADQDELRERLVRMQRRVSYAEQVADVTGAETVRGRLDQRTVAVVALPGADARIVRELDELLATAGATVSRSLQITEKWVDPGQRQFLDDLSADLVTDEVELPKGSAYDRAATVLAGAVFGESAGSDDRATDRPSDASTAAAEDAEDTDEARDGGNADEPATVLGAYDEGDLVRSGRDRGPADLVVVVAPASEEQHAYVQRSDGAPWMALARAFDRAGEGTVVAGPAEAARGTGALAVIRSDAATASEISTVDVADRSLGPTVVAMALVEQADGAAGHYGMVGPIDGALPG